MFEGKVERLEEVLQGAGRVLKVAICAAGIEIDLLLLGDGTFCLEVLHQPLYLFVGAWHDVGLVAQPDVQQAVFVPGVLALAAHVKRVKHRKRLPGVLVAEGLYLLHLLQLCVA